MDDDKRKEHIEILLKECMNKILTQERIINSYTSTINNNIAEIAMLEELNLTIKNNDNEFEEEKKIN